MQSLDGMLFITRKCNDLKSIENELKRFEKPNSSVNFSKYSRKTFIQYLFNIYSIKYNISTEFELYQMYYFDVIMFFQMRT